MHISILDSKLDADQRKRRKVTKGGHPSAWKTKGDHSHNNLTFISLTLEMRKIKYFCPVEDNGNEEF